LYYIESEASTDHRPDHLKMDKYTEIPISFREVVIFKKQLPIIKNGLLGKKRLDTKIVICQWVQLKQKILFKIIDYAENHYLYV